MISFLKSRARLIRERDEAVILAQRAAAKYAACLAMVAALKNEVRDLEFHLKRARNAETRSSIEAVEVARQLTAARAEISVLRQKLAHTSASQPRDWKGRFVGRVSA